MTNAVNPSHYKDGWSDGAELISISEHLTSNGGQALQYVARSTRLDQSMNKGKTVGELVEDLEKAKWFIDREIERIQSPPPATPKGYFTINGTWPFPPHYPGYHAGYYR